MIRRQPPVPPPAARFGGQRCAACQEEHADCECDPPEAEDVPHCRLLHPCRGRARLLPSRLGGSLALPSRFHFADAVCVLDFSAWRQSPQQPPLCLSDARIALPGFELSGAIAPSALNVKFTS